LGDAIGFWFFFTEDILFMLLSSFTFDMNVPCMTIAGSCRACAGRIRVGDETNNENALTAMSIIREISVLFRKHFILKAP
jgi:hypothetical protein